MRLLLLITFLLLNSLSFAQEVNPRWFGQWQAKTADELETLTIDAEYFKWVVNMKGIQKPNISNCKFVKKVPKKFSNDCVMIYGGVAGTLSKGEILDLYKNALNELKRGYQDSNGRKIPLDKAELKKFTEIKVLIDELSNDRFRFVMPFWKSDLEGREDAQMIGFFLDRDNVYKIMNFPTSLSSFTFVKYSKEYSRDKLSL
jgi:hypothetical protein